MSFPTMYGIVFLVTLRRFCQFFLHLVIKKIFLMCATYRVAIRLAPVAIGFANTRQNDDVKKQNLKNFDDVLFNIQCKTDVKNFQGGKL